MGAVVKKFDDASNRVMDCANTGGTSVRNALLCHPPSTITGRYFMSISIVRASLVGKLMEDEKAVVKWPDK